MAVAHRPARRRAALVVASLWLGGPWALAQTQGRVYRVGILRLAARPLKANDPQAVGIPNGLRDLGYVEGRNLVLDIRYAGGDGDRAAVLAREMVQAHPDAVVGVGAVAIRALRAASPDVPLVMFGNFDPIANGLVASLARPGGNTTGVLIAPDGTLAGKRLELLKAAVPSATRIGLLAPADTVAFQLQADETQKAGVELGVRVIMVEVRGNDYPKAFAELAASKVDALLVGAHNFFVRDRRQIIDLASRYRMPAMYEWREQVDDGGLMSYSADLQTLHRRVASHVDRILKGTSAGEIPVEQPTRFELAINLKAARAIGLTIPPALRLQVDSLIE